MGDANPTPERSESYLRDFRSASLEVSLGISRDRFVTSRGQIQTYGDITRPLEVRNVTSDDQITTSRGQIQTYGGTTRPLEVRNVICDDQISTS